MLKDERMGNVERDSADALAFFGNDLTRRDTNGVFMYRKTGVIRVANSAKGIAKKWQKLLDNDTAIAARWEQWKAEHGQ